MNINAVKIFTTGQVAKICDVSTHTVSKWFDSGQLRGYRIPCTKDRRIVPAAPNNDALRTNTGKFVLAARTRTLSRVPLSGGTGMSIF